MKVIADLQIHSRYSRACSQDLNPGNIAVWADKKGIAVIGTGDLTHPLWNKELQDSLVESEPGLYKMKDGKTKARFMLTSEVSSIYKQGDKVRRIHNMILSPSFEAASKVIQGLEKLGCNLKSDGRPIIGVHSDDLVKVVLEADQRNVVIPAHVWTPHFGLFGSMSGFDSVEEAFGDYSKYIFALETGLSSDPIMNWQISSLDKYSFVSNSDAHSLRKIGREANAFEIPESKLSYDAIIDAIKSKDPKKFLHTIEFYPGEGKYHLDGHADCKFSCTPKETEKLKGICPKCGKKLLLGVLNRVFQLADREYGYTPKNAVSFRNVTPLEEIIAETYEVGVASKKTLNMYEQMVAASSEFDILLEMQEEEIAKISDANIATSVLKVRTGNVHVEGGYDGIFGKVRLYDVKERASMIKKPRQVDLF